MLASITRLDMKNRFELQANCAAGIALSLRFEIYQPPRYKRFATHNFNKVAHFSKMNLIVFFFLAILALVTIQLLIFCIFIFRHFIWLNSFAQRTSPMRSSLRKKTLLKKAIIQNACRIWSAQWDY